jgi:hypothetical protein
LYKNSGELLFKRPLWTIAAGNRRNELSLYEMFNAYRSRFDIEHFFRFGKQRLLMDKFQTPDVNHEESWWQLVMIAYNQLYLGRKLANNSPNPWEKYLPTFKTMDLEEPKQALITAQNFDISVEENTKRHDATDILPEPYLKIESNVIIPRLSPATVAVNLDISIAAPIQSQFVEQIDGIGTADPITLSGIARVKISPITSPVQLPGAVITMVEKSPTQVQKDWNRIIRQIGTPAKSPRPYKKSIGRQYGDLQVKRIHFPVIVKGKKKTNLAEMKA